MVEIQMRNLTRCRGNFVGVQGFDLTISDRAFHGLPGPSGCGKTTTMRMIAGLEDVTNADIPIDGERRNDLAPKNRDIAMVFQSDALYPDVNIYASIRFPPEVRKACLLYTSPSPRD